MLTLEICKDEYQSEIMELIKPFEARTNMDIDLRVDYNQNGNSFHVCVQANTFENFAKNFIFPFDAKTLLEIKRVEKRYIKIAVYRTLTFLTGVSLPYGCLTGIRPTKLYCEIENNQEKYNKSAHDVFVGDYGVSQEKIELIERVVNTQKHLRNQSSRQYDVFVFIPFCPTRCAYCSFVSLSMEKQRKLVEPYVECLVKELEQTHQIVKQKRLKIRSVYVGGGTPTSIGAQLLDRVLEHCHFNADEFTVEAGRPDTINDEIIAVLEKHKVTRISVNPQTFNDKTLEIIGRNHRSAETYNAYLAVRDKFDVNMDLIAMLPNETFEDFKRSVDIAVALNPANITVHTLYMKKGSDLKNENYDNTDFETASQMVDYAYNKLIAAGYNPYYMYRQKYTSGNLENVGYAKPGKECIYNIDIMEEDTSILANGANAISKKWQKKIQFISRCANYKNPLEYIKNFDKVLEKQREFWS